MENFFVVVALISVASLVAGMGCLALSGTMAALTRVDRIAVRVRADR